MDFSMKAMTLSLVVRDSRQIGVGFWLHLQIFVGFGLPRKVRNSLKFA
jgi:hypothetical protein